MKAIGCVIVEDEIPVAEELKYLLSGYEFIDILGMAHNGEAGIKLIRETNPDAVFLDVNMPVFSGIRLAEMAKEFNRDISIIFVTAYEKHAIKAFEVEALDYVLKPFDKKRIDLAVKRLRERAGIRMDSGAGIPVRVTEIINKLDREQKLLKKIPCENNGKIMLVNTNDIYYCYIDNDKTYVKTKDKNYYTSYNLSEIEEKTGFFRAHRSYLVNTDHIKELYAWFNGTYKLIMDDNEMSEVTVSRTNVKRLKGLLGL